MPVTITLARFEHRYGCRTYLHELSERAASRNVEILSAMPNRSIAVVRRRR